VFRKSHITQQKQEFLNSRLGAKKVGSQRLDTRGGLHRRSLGLCIKKTNQGRIVSSTANKNPSNSGFRNQAHQKAYCRDDTGGEVKKNLSRERESRDNWLEANIPAPDLACSQESATQKVSTSKRTFAARSQNCYYLRQCLMEKNNGKRK